MSVWKIIDVKINISPGLDGKKILLRNFLSWGLYGQKCVLKNLRSLGLYGKMILLKNLLRWRLYGKRIILKNLCRGWCGKKGCTEKSKLGILWKIDCTENLSCELYRKISTEKSKLGIVYLTLKSRF